MPFGVRQLGADQLDRALDIDRSETVDAKVRQTQ